MRHHIDVLGLLHIVWGVFAALAGLSLLLLSGGTRAAIAAENLTGSGPFAAAWLLAITGGFLLAAGVALLLTGRRLRALTPGARLTALILAIPNLLLLPFGTALGVYTYWVLLNNDARDEFGRPHRSAAV